MKKYLTILASVLIIANMLLGFDVQRGKIEAEIAQSALNTDAKLVMYQENSLASLSNPNNPEPKVARRIDAIITAYSSTPWQTDEDPFITAAGTGVRDGIIANNALPFGTKVRIPDLYGDKIFVVEDRMSWKKGNDHFDIWFAEYRQALNFGAQRTYIEVLES
ncbi:MAG: 3D domain-containing protein [bacterium]